MGYYKLKNVGPFTSISIADWLRKHGHAVRPELSRRERGELEECFRLIDADGSGAIDVDEMFEAFQLLGLRVSKKQVEDMLAEVDADGSGEIEIPEFIEIMTMTRQTSEKQEEEAREAGGAPGKDKEPAAMPLHLLTVAYRRKKMLEGVMYDEGNTREKLIVKGIENEERRQQEKAKLQRAVHAVTGVSTLMKVMHAISHVRSDASGKAGSEKEAGKGDVASVTDREEGDHPDEDEEDLEFKPLSESCPTLRFDADGHFAGMVADAASEKAASEAVTETEGYTWIAPTPEQEAERTQKIVASVRARFADEEAEVQRLAGRHTMQGLSRSFSADQPIPFLDPSQSAVSVDMAMQRLALTRRDRGDPHDRRAMSSMAVLKREGSYRADPLSVTQVLGKFPSLQFREVFELPSVAGADLIASRKLLLNIAQPTPGQPRRSNLDASIRASRPVICRRRRYKYLSNKELNAGGE
ncbi:hypothetical protein WJX72_000922 [[Myrmecia] bisecta]|uniref:Caltractin n=1 Tax=[Myrmecia] bisecta TaxID=41462 RepID=A0AAW1R594_9CHLO